MTHSTALPFVLRRSAEEVGIVSVTSSTETIHGLLRLDGDRLVIQWRLARETSRVGAVTSDTVQELEDVREVVLSLASVAGAAVRPRRWWQPWRGPHLMLTAADLRAFEAVTGAAGLRLDHPAELVLGLRRTDALPAAEVAAELSLAVAELEAERPHERLA